MPKVFVVKCHLNAVSLTKLKVFAKPATKDTLSTMVLVKSYHLKIKSIQAASLGTANTIAFHAQLDSISTHRRYALKSLTYAIHGIIMVPAHLAMEDIF